MLLSIVVYGFMMCSMYYLGKISIYSNNSRLYICISLLIFALFSGWRYDVGVDYLSYLNDLKYIEGGSSFNEAVSGLDRFELGYLFISYCILKLGLGYPAVFAFWAFIQCFCIYYAFKDEKYLYPFLVFTLIASSGYFLWMNAMRQMVAFSMFILAIRFLHGKKYLPYIIIMGCAYLVHKSAMNIGIIGPLFMFANKKIPSKILQLVLFILSYALSGELLIDSVSEMANSALLYSGDFGERYLNDDVFESYSSLRFGGRALISLGLNVIMILYSRKFLTYFKTSFFTIIYNVYFIGTILYQLFIFNHHLVRFVSYFSSVDFIVYSYGLAYFFRKNRTPTELMVGICMILSLFLYFFIQLASDDGTGHILYRFYQ